jgi:hypothetical protein
VVGGNDGVTIGDAPQGALAGVSVSEKSAGKQAAKYHLSLAGEYYVAAELQRRGIHASVTYGNAKQTDVVAFSDESTRAVVIEVKSTGQPDWIVGNKTPEPSVKPWVFVHIPLDANASPEFYVLTQSQIHELLAPSDAEYYRRYRERHGRESTGIGVVTLSRKQAAPFKGCWQTIIDAVKAAD